MAESGETPSPISSIQESSRPRYDSHESFGFQESRRRTYSLANSVTGPEANQSQQIQPPQSANDSDIFANDMHMSSDPAFNTAADISMASIALADESERARPSNTTRILQRALEANPKWDTGVEAFTDYPPRGVRHADYNKNVEELPDDLSAYTQVIIWCIARRIEHLRKAPAEKLRLSLLLVNVLQSLQLKLQTRQVTPSSAYQESLRLKPKMANPSNEWYLVVKSRLKTAYDTIHETSRESYNIAGHFEKLGVVSNAAAPIEFESVSVELEESLKQHNAKLRHRVVSLLEGIVDADGLALQAHQVAQERSDLQERQKLMDLCDPLSILRAATNSRH